MAKLVNCMLWIINILIIILTITNLILVSNINDKTEDNPLEVYEKSENAFDDDDDETNNIILEYTKNVSEELSKLRKYCQCDEKILDNICTEKQIASGCYDVSKNNKSTALRYLEENCEKIKTKIENTGKFSKVFVLNYDMVHKMAHGILIVLIILLIFVGLNLLGLCCDAIIPVIFIAGLIIFILSLFINFILFIIMIVSYYKGSTAEFLNFYEDCLEDEGKSKALQDTYEAMNNIKKYMMAFTIINFILIGLYIIDVIIICKKQK